MMTKKAKFLLIDDAPFIREELIASLNKLDFKGPYLEAEDGDKALLILRDPDIPAPDFIICDIYMPNKDGLTLLSEIKNNQVLKKPTPILMLTSENERKIVVECMKLGATNYLLKPWTQIELAKKLVSSWEKIHPESADQQ